MGVKISLSKELFFLRKKKLSKLFSLKKSVLTGLAGVPNSASKLLSHICLTRPSCWLSRTALLTNWYLICATTGWGPDYSCVWGRHCQRQTAEGLAAGSPRLESHCSLTGRGEHWNWLMEQKWGLCTSLESKVLSGGGANVLRNTHITTLCCLRMLRPQRPAE